MKIGLPRALLYYRYGKFWEGFFTELGADVVVSRKTDEEILRQGLPCVSSEVCLPIKIVAGHLVELVDKVDVIFFPRLNWLGDRLFACPKMIGIVDVARMLLGMRVRLIAPRINGDLFRPHFAAGLAITHNPARVWRAWQRTRWLLKERAADGAGCGQTDKRRVAVLGHFYNLGDEFVSRPIVRTFENHGYQIVTKEMLPPGVLLGSAGFGRNIRWVYERELYNAFEYFLGKVDGFCVVVSMGCGPDSLVAEFMRTRAREIGTPFLLLVIDEHTGEAGLITRIEAFIELVKRRGKTRQIAG